MSILNLFKKRGHSSAAAAIPHDAEGQYRLGCKYATGQGVGQDFVLAYKWLSFAVAHGHSAAVEMRDTIADRMTPQQVAEAERLVANHAPARLVSV